MAASAEIIAKIGLDTASFAAGLDRANNHLTQFAGQASAGIRGVTRVVGDLRSVFLAGGIFAAAKSFFDSAIEYSRNYQGAMNENVNATLRFADSLDKWEQAKASLSSAVIGAVEKGTIGLSALIYGVDAATAAWDEMNAATQRSLDDKRAKDYAAELERLAKTNRDIAYGEADSWGKLTLLINEQLDLKKQIRAVGADTVEGLKLQGQLAKSEEQSRKIMSALAADESRTIAEKQAKEKATTEELEKQKAIREALVKKAKEEADEAERKMRAEATVAVDTANQAAAKQGFSGLTQAEADALSAWVAGGKKGPEPKITRSGQLRDSLTAPLTRYRNEMLGPVRSQGDFAQASVPVIEEELRRYSALLFRLRDIVNNPSYAPDAASGDIVRGLAISQVERNRQAAQAELNQRRALSSQSYAQALRNYEGDPLNFDRLYQQAKGTYTEQQESNKLLRDLNQRTGAVASALHNLRTLPPSRS